MFHMKNHYLYKFCNYTKFNINTVQKVTFAAKELDKKPWPPP